MSRAPSEVDALRQMREAEVKAAEKRAAQKKAEPLSDRERHELNDLEMNIRGGFNAFVLVGASLAHIREKRLYRDDYESFEEYVEDKWGWTAARARQLISAHAVVEDIGQSVTTGNGPASERVVREMVAVPREKRAEAWTEVVETAPDGKPTAKHTRKVAERHMSAAARSRRKEKKSPPSPSSTATTGDTVAGLDGRGGGLHEGSPGEAGSAPGVASNRPPTDQGDAQAEADLGSSGGPEVNGSGGSVTGSKPAPGDGDKPTHASPSREQSPAESGNVSASSTTGGPAQQVESHAGGPAHDATAGSPVSSTPAGEAVEPTTRGVAEEAPAPAGVSLSWEAVALLERTIQTARTRWGCKWCKAVDGTAHDSDCPIRAIRIALKSSERTEPA